MKMTLVAGALALAVAGQANAAILGNSTTVGGSDLILSAWDSTNNTSYTVDLGVTMASFLAAPTTAAAASNLGNLGADANFKSFLAGVAATDTTNWNIVGMTGATSYLFTSATTPTPDSVSGVKTFNSASDLYMTSASLAAGAGTSAYVVGTSTTSGYAGYQFGSNFGGKSTGFSNSAAIGSTMNFFGETALTRTGTGVVTPYAQTFTLTTAGLNVAAVAAVPEPGEWLLMLSGLALIGFIATRRKNEGSMMFA
jgi:hypothetical protein